MYLPDANTLQERKVILLLVFDLTVLISRELFYRFDNLTTRCQCSRFVRRRSVNNLSKQIQNEFVARPATIYKLFQKFDKLRQKTIRSIHHPSGRIRQ